MRTVLAVVFGVIAALAGAAWLYLQVSSPASPPAVVQVDAAAGTPSVAPQEAGTPEAPVAVASAPEAVAPSPDDKRARSISEEDAVLQEMQAAEAAASERVVAAASAPAPEADAPEAAPEPAPAPAPVAASAGAGPSVAVADQYKSRRVTYNRPPATLALDRTIDVSLVINATDDKDAGAEALQGFPGTVVERDVELSDSVAAQLTGVGFTIVTQTVGRQKLSGRTINRWQWQVTPREPGTHTLILEIFGYASGSNDAEPLDAYRDEIRVEVQQVERLVSMAGKYQPLFAAIAGLAGLISALLALLRFREERRRKAPELEP
jgi:hypothetical protein